MKMKQLFILLAVIVCSSVAFGATGSFQGVGDLPGDKFFSRAFGVSDDGTTVVGFSIDASSSHGQAFRWTQEDGIVGLGYLDGAANSWSTAYGISSDGSIVVGTGNNASSDWEAFRWTEADGIVGLGTLGGTSSKGSGVSSDGSVIVGWATHSVGVNLGFRWTEADGMVALLGTSAANDVSADGSVVVGYSMLPGSNREGYQWTKATGPIFFGSSDSIGEAVSADGSVVVGRWEKDNNENAYRWTQATGLVSLGHLPGHSKSHAYDVSSDGSLVVGYSQAWSSGYMLEQKAFIWDAEHGMRSLQDVLSNEYGMDLTGWSLTIATAISPDGQTIVGRGHNPNGDLEGWIATIPEPATLSLLVVGGLVMLRRRSAQVLRRKK